MTSTNWFVAIDRKSIEPKSDFNEVLVVVWRLINFNSNDDIRSRKHPRFPKFAKSRINQDFANCFF
jgi:hypothetical protein